MSSELDQARLIAARIVQRVSQEVPTQRPAQNGSSDISAELAAMRASLGQLQERLIQIEAKVTSGRREAGASTGTFTSPRVPPTHSPWLAGVNAATHPSQEKFGVEEATVSELVDFFQNEKTCSVEPGGKPCDHCAMCSTRGF
ncbi:MAG TPA: hypothetical protein VLA93_15750 [Pyrinomonadaceae bacterium]|nr:hypothetical protein [Pyrinomonadaceae bacterium]